MKIGSPPAPLLAVVGPTASGKSHLALHLAAESGGEIVNCDSLQIYRGLDIGTAKTPPAERMAIPHHLFDILPPDAVFSAGEYAALGRSLLAEITARGRLPVITGGTGFYLRALLEGLAEGPRRDDRLRARLSQAEQRHPGCLWRVLTRFDRVTAERIHPNDHHKLIRAVEICLLARRPASALFRAGRPALEGYRTLKIGLNPPRAELKQRIARRSVAMFAGGLADELRGLLAGGLTRDAKALESIGYKECLALIEGRLSEPEAIDLTTIATRQYAKRQLTWFRREPDIRWIDGFGDDPAALAQARALLAELRSSVYIPDPTVNPT